MTFSSKSLGHERTDTNTLRSSIIPTYVQRRRLSDPQSDLHAQTIFTIRMQGGLHFQSAPRRAPRY